jgi:hypothetical protein
MRILIRIPYVVFPLASEGFNGGSVAQSNGHEHIDNVPSQVFNETSNTWFDNSLEGLGNETGWADKANLDITGNGLYWFWESTWGDSRA